VADGVQGALTVYDDAMTRAADAAARSGYQRGVQIQTEIMADAAKQMAELLGWKDS